MPVKTDVMRGVIRGSAQSEVRRTYQTLFQMLDAQDIIDAPLEDVFTMLDRLRKSGETIRGLSHAAIEASYQTLIRAVSLEFERRLAQFDQEPYLAFFRELIERRLADPADGFAIMTLNWDTIPDFMIEKLGAPLGAGPDYACYDYDLDDVDGHVPSLLLKSKGKPNVKLFKLHGSLNWLICPCCGRLFSARAQHDHPPVARPDGVRCRFCPEVDLETLIISPTLIKDLSHTHLKMIWHIALMDLQEADRIVFVGYSFPLADFEFRYMLLKAVTGRRENLSIRVALYPPDHLCHDPRRRWERDQEERNYRNFFGRRDIDFKYLDARDFMTDPALIWDW
jgi:hypothetical protein